MFAQLSEYGCISSEYERSDGHSHKVVKKSTVFVNFVCETLTYQYLSHGLGSEATNIFEDSA